MWVPRCMMPSKRCTSSPSLAWNSWVMTFKFAFEGHCAMPCPQRWLRLKNCRPSVVVGFMFSPPNSVAGGLSRSGAFSGFHPVFAARVENRHQPDDAGIALVPVPGEALKGAAFSAQGRDIAAHVFDGRNSPGENGLVRRIPLGEVLDRFAAGGPLVFGEEILDLRAVAMRPERGRQRMIDLGRIDAHEFHVLRREPFAGRLAQSGSMTEVLLAVGVLLVPAGVDDHDVPRQDLRRGFLEIGGFDRLPL